MDRVVVVHKSSAERERLRRLLERLEVAVDVVVDADAALERVRSTTPALVLLDAESGGLELCREISDTAASTSIVMICSKGGRPSDRIAALLVGADDVVSEPFDRDELLARIRRMLERRRRWLAVPPQQPNLLSPRELEVLELLAAGRPSVEIARDLVISRKTVVTHIQHIFTKLGVHSQAQAVAHAHLRGLVGSSRHAAPAALGAGGRARDLR